jgi:hypothetical protein
VSSGRTDDNAVARLYTQFDIGAKRSMPDRMRALDIAKYVNLTTKQANLIVTGAPYLKYKFGKITTFQVSQMNPFQRLEIGREYEQGAREYFKVMATAEDFIQKVFLKPHFSALGAFLYQHSPEHANYLWIAISRNETEGDTDPRRHMFNVAANAESSNNGGGGIKRYLATVQAFIAGWNLMVERQPLIKKLTVAPAPTEAVSIFGLDELIEREQVQSGCWGRHESTPLDEN